MVRSRCRTGGPHWAVRAPRPPASTFIGIRADYRSDPACPQVQASLDGGSAPTFTYNRFWAQVDIALANATYGLLFSLTR